MLRADDPESRRRRILLSGNPLRVDLPRRLELSAGAAFAWLRHVHHDTAPAPRAGSSRTARDTRTFVQGCLLPVATAAQRYTRSRRRRAAIMDEVVGLNGWGSAMTTRRRTAGTDRPPRGLAPRSGTAWSGMRAGWTGAIARYFGRRTTTAPSTITSDSSARSTTSSTGPSRYHSTQTRYQHYLLNHTVELDGDEAHAETYYLFVGTDREPANHMTLSRAVATWIDWNDATDGGRSSTGYVSSSGMRSRRRSSPTR